MDVGDYGPLIRFQRFPLVERLIPKKAIHHQSHSHSVIRALRAVSTSVLPRFLHQAFSPFRCANVMWYAWAHNLCSQKHYDCALYVQFCRNKCDYHYRVVV